MKPFLYVLFLLLSFLSEISNAQPNNRKAIEELTRQEKSLRIHADAAARDAQLSLDAISSAKTMEEADSLKTSGYALMEKSKDLKVQALQSFHKQESLKTRLTNDDRLRQSVEVDNLKFNEDKKIQVFGKRIYERRAEADEYLNPSKIRMRELQEKIRIKEIELENFRADSADRMYDAGARLREIQLEQAGKQR